MSLWHIAWSYLWNRKLTTCLTILSVGMAVGLISSVLTLRDEVQRRFEEEGQAFDIVIGAKGSPLQLVLSSVYFMDQPTGNIEYSLYEEILQETEYVKDAFPIGMGDSYQGFRIVGTVERIFDHQWESPVTGNIRAPFALAEGERFDAPMEAVLGAAVAEQSGLRVGDQFVGTHGFIELPENLREHDHSDKPYTVVGIMKPSASPFDRAIFCSLESVWHAHSDHDHAEDDGDHGHAHDEEHVHSDECEHEHHDHGHVHTEACDHEDHDHGHDHHDDEVTAILVQLQTAAYRFQYKEKILTDTKAMAVIPIMEIQKLFDQVLATAKQIMLAVGYLVVIISAISILIGLYLAILQRKRDLAVMRALGASAYEIFGAVIIEAFIVTLLGIASGWAIGKGTTFALGLLLAERYGLVITAYTTSTEELTAYATVALMGLVAGILPAWQAYNSDVAKDLYES